MNIKLLAFGNAGGNIAEAIRREGKDTPLKLAKFVFADCNADDLTRREAEGCETICLRADNESFPKYIFEGIEQLIVVAGLGGMTATKFTVLAVEAAKASGVTCITVVATLPFLFEGEKRIERAMYAANRIANLDGVDLKLYNNEGLVEKYPDLNFIMAFDIADKKMANIVLANIYSRDTK